MKDRNGEQPHFHGAGSVPGLHQVCSSLILPADEVVERNPSSPVKAEEEMRNKLEEKPA